MQAEMQEGSSGMQEDAGRGAGRDMGRDAGGRDAGMMQEGCRRIPGDSEPHQCPPRRSAPLDALHLLSPPSQSLPSTALLVLNGDTNPAEGGSSCGGVQGCPGVG